VGNLRARELREEAFEPDWVLVQDAERLPLHSLSPAAAVLQSGGTSPFGSSAPLSR
jgi:hypothetical protein